MSKTTRLIVAATIVSTALAVSACGKRPSFVDAPEGVTNDTYDKSYPAPADRSKKTDGLSFP